MNFDEIAHRGLVMLGCGKMGSALLAGWLDQGLPASAAHIIDPNPSDWLRQTGVRINETLPKDAAVLVVAVKPQIMDDALPQIAHYGGGSALVISVAAGTPLARFEATFGAGTRVVRAMPNTPAAIGQGISAIIGNAACSPRDLDLADALLRAVGQVVRLETEDQIDIVTGLSGSGPAYVFHLIEAMAAAGQAQGLAPDLAMDLAKATVAGSGALAQSATDSPAQLRVNVTSPKGTTEAGLAILMDEKTGLTPLIKATVAAAVARARALKS